VRDDSDDWGYQMHNSPQRPWLREALEEILVERPVNYLLAGAVGMLVGFILGVAV